MEQSKAKLAWDSTLTEDKLGNARQKIEAGEWVDCAICAEVFRRRRQTMRYCLKCNRGFCEGEHGNFSRGVGTCVFCGQKKPKVAKVAVA